MFTDGEDHGRMRRVTAITTALLTVTLTGTALAGCSSSDSSDESAKPSASAGTPSATPTTSPVPTKTANGRLDYTGDTTGTALFTSAISCEVVAGRLVGVTAPDRTDASAPKSPSFIATTGGVQKLAMLQPTATDSYSQRSSGSVTAAKSAGTWKVTVKDLVIAGNHGDDRKSITVNGSLTCTKLTGQ
ncbi:hypothetical protein ABZX65_01095 [Streptomyces sp. NPDC003300]|uniref:hypothetical protein n=1 Tax=unclassified Streptomyces TaxID=2593676 RepID=UPI00339DF38D